jgi:hypothetical protein
MRLNPEIVFMTDNQLHHASGHDLADRGIQFISAEPAALLQASARKDGVLDRQERTRRERERDRR